MKKTKQIKEEMAKNVTYNKTGLALIPLRDAENALDRIIEATANDMVGEKELKCIKAFWDKIKGIDRILGMVHFEDSPETRYCKTEFSAMKQMSKEARLLDRIKYLEEQIAKRDELINKKIT